MRVSQKLIALLMVTILCCAPLPAAMAQDRPAAREAAIIDVDDKLEKMAVDAVVVRPLYLRSPAWQILICPNLNEKERFACRFILSIIR